MFRNVSELRAALAALPPAEREMVNELWKQGHWAEAIRSVDMLRRLKVPAVVDRTARFSRSVAGGDEQSPKGSNTR
jgi:hypothetical protein